MLKWIARRTQIVALQQDVATLTDRLSTALDRIDTETARSASLADRLDALERHVGEQDALLSDIRNRLSDTDDRARRVDAERAGTADYLDRMILRYDLQGEEAEKLHTDLARLTKRFDLHAEDMTRTAKALLDRIERNRGLRTD